MYCAIKINNTNSFCRQLFDRPMWCSYSPCYFRLIIFFQILEERFIEEENMLCYSRVIFPMCQHNLFYQDSLGMLYVRWAIVIIMCAVTLSVQYIYIYFKYRQDDGFSCYTNDMSPTLITEITRFFKSPRIIALNNGSRVPSGILCNGNFF